LTEDNRCIYCGTKINIGGKIWPTWKLENRFRYIPIASLTRYVRIDISSIAKRS